ncbi:MAG TPA: hypothetical protein VFM37_00305, partial [Pseudonocardiaceae bacterium]|nr:hypothetical protein [Pseudonocardiaceae bacterium]
MRQRRLTAVVVGFAALAAAVGGVVGNHLPWPGLLDRHPLWTTAAFFAFSTVAAIIAVALFMREGSPDGTGDAADPVSVTASPAATTVAGGSNVVAGTGGIAVGSGGSLVLPPVAEPAEPLPPPRVALCLGRDDDVAVVVAEWISGRSAVVLGGPGIGKSTVLGRAVADDAVVTAFGSLRRFVVSCDGAESARGVVDKLAQVLGVAVGDRLWNRVVSFLRGAPCVLVLDNFETVADSDAQGAAELVSTLRSDGCCVVLGIGYRGAALPFAIDGVVEVGLGPLRPDTAKDVFVAAAGDGHRGDPHLNALVAVADGVPLAIRLLGSLARTEPSLDTLLLAWRAKRTSLLQRGVRPDRTSSLPVSIELSWQRLSDDARAALSLAAHLPDGWPRGRWAMYLPESLAAGVIELAGRALLHDDGARQRCLTPIRQHVLAHHPVPSTLLRQFLAPVIMLIQRCQRVGGADGAAIVTELTPEFTNLVEVIRACLPIEPGLADVVPGLLEFQRFTGLGDVQLGMDAIDASPSTATQAANAFALGLLSAARSDNGRARELFGQALPLYRRVGDVLGEANCLR